MRPLVLASAALALSLASLPACVTPEVQSATVAGEETAPLSIALNAPQSGLYSSAQPAATDWPLIAAKGVNTVIDLRMPGELKDRDEAAEVRAAGMEYHRIPVDGLAGINTQNAQALAEKLARAKGPVLIHCSTANRAGGLLALVQAQAGVPEEQALEFGRAAGMKGSEEKVRQILDSRVVE